LFDPALNDVGSNYVELVFFNLSPLSGQLTLGTVDFDAVSPGLTRPFFDMSRTVVLFEGEGLSIGSRGGLIEVV
jgi:hypothetical protein